MEENIIQPPEAGTMEAGASPAATEGAQTIGGLPAEQFYSALQEFSGGVIKESSDIERFKNVEQEYQSLQTKYAQLEMEKNVNPFANPLAEAINRMAADGATPAEIRRFVEFQSVDVDNMDPIEAYKTSLRFKYPDLTPQDVEEYMATQFGLTEEKPVTSTLKVEGLKAKEELRKMKVDSSNTEASQRRQAEQQQISQLKSNWETLLQKQFAAYTVPVKHEQPDFKYENSFKPSDTALQFAKQVVMSDVLQNKLPLTADAQARANDLIHRMAIAADLENYTKTIISDAYARGKLAAVQSVTGKHPAAPSPAAATGKQEPQPRQRGLG